MSDLTKEQREELIHWAQSRTLDAQTNGIASAEHSFMFGEHMACPDETGVSSRHWIEPTDIVHFSRAFYPLRPPGSLLCLGAILVCLRVAVWSLKTEAHALSPGFLRRQSEISHVVNTPEKLSSQSFSIRLFVVGLQLGSQFNSFIFNVSPTEHGVCGRVPRLSAGITNYPSLLKFTHPWTLGSPQNPPSARQER